MVCFMYFDAMIRLITKECRHPMSKLIITVVAALAIAAVVTAIVIPNLNPSDPEKQYAIEFEDGEGNLIQLESAPESIVCINTLPAIAMKILGLQDKVDEILFYKTANKYQYYHDAGFNNITEDTPFYSTLTTADYFVEHNMKVIVETIGASPMSETLERSCKDNGITIIKLDCYGDTMLEDMEKLVKLFGNPASSVKALNDYKSLRNGVISGVLSKCSPIDDNLFLFEMMGLGAFYNENGEVAKVVEKIYGKNAVREMGFAPTTKSTTTAKEDAPLESLTVIDGNKPIKLLLLRASAGAGAHTRRSAFGHASRATADIRTAHTSAPLPQGATGPRRRVASTTTGNRCSTLERT